MVAYQTALSELTACLDTTTLLDLACRFSETYRALAKDSTEHFLTTPVTVLPTGKEQGKFLAIDVGGSNLRVGFVELLGESGTVRHGEHQIEDDVSTIVKRGHDKSWPIGDHLKMDQPEDLFRWIGDCMAEVIREAIEAASLPKDQDVQLGVTFSFPMAQTTLSEATLLPMGKGFAISSNLNLGEMLLAGYSRHCTPGPEEPGATITSPHLPNISVAAITNDTVATLISLAYVFKPSPTARVAMGLIVGTGTNATVPMAPTSLHPSKQNQLLESPSSTSSSSSSSSPPTSVVINTEWTIRGTDAPLTSLGLKTQYDHDLDAHSDAPGFQPFEYMTSGRYLGEIVRLAFLDTLADNNDSEDNDTEEQAEVPDRLRSRHSLPTRFLSETVMRSEEAALPAALEHAYPSSSSSPRTHTTTASASASASPSPALVPGFWTPARARHLRDLAVAVQRRSSALIAAACVGLLDCVGDISIQPLLPSPSTTPPPSTASPRHAHRRAIPQPQTQSQSQAQDEDKAEGREQPPTELIVAFTGSTISHYPSWRTDCQRWLDELVRLGAGAGAGGSSVGREEPEAGARARVRVVLREAVDGGIVGAGVLAGMGTTGR